MKRFNKYISAITLGATIMVVPSCTDAWDDHYGTESTTSATSTLWEQISKNPELSRFATLAENTCYYRDEKHPQKDYTFKDMLNSTQKLTVFAPLNSSFTDEEYARLLELTKTDGYSVQQELLGNNICLWSNVVSGDAESKITMVNGKNYQLDMKAKTIAEQDLVDMNIAASNGTLHTVTSKIPFAYNIYEYIKSAANAEAKGVKRFRDYIVANDTTYFFESSSIQGPSDENGNPTYVDSAFVTSNLMFTGTKRFPSNTNTEQYLTYTESFGANINEEDSTWVMVIPTDDAWQAAYEKLEKLYNYGTFYMDNAKINGGTDNQKRDKINADSLKALNIDMDILSPLCFNLNMQPNENGKKRTWKLDDFLSDKGARATYLLNTYGDTLRSDDTWQKESIFQGTTEQLSNGVAFLSNEWTMPHKLYQPDIVIEAGMNWYRYPTYNQTKREYEDNAYFKKIKSIGSYPFSNGSHKWAKETDYVSFNNFVYVMPTLDTQNPTITIALKGTHGETTEQDVMSGKYDIYAVLVPNYYITSNDTAIVHTVGTNGTGFITAEGDTIPVKHKFKATINYIDKVNATKEATKNNTINIDYNGEKVEQVLLFEDFEFPVSYKNLRHSYPTLTLVSNTVSKDRREGYSNDFCIDKIILVSKEE